MREPGLDRSFWVKAIFLFLLAFTLYFISRSPGLDEIDSINFALGAAKLPNKPNPIK